ncbi:MAG: CPBP family intramembrane metalloprotease [Methanomassiliicoccus sp.]|nr:CPBP family intramembrane metalloprotease [Methanomassiliicoccus sp.]
MTTSFSSTQVHEEVRWPVLTLLSLPFVCGCASIYLYRLMGIEEAALAALFLLVFGLLSAMVMVLFVEQREVALAASSVVLVQALALVVMLLPNLNWLPMEHLPLLVVMAGAIVIHYRSVQLPVLRSHPLLLRSVMIVLVLPLGLALAEALFLGYRFFENFHIGRSTIMMIPIIAVWGYLEEVLFRGIALRSSLPLLGRWRAILFSASLGAVFMLFWGSLPYAFFAFFLGIVMGVLYMRSHSLMFVGTVHALTDIWMVVALLILGVTG